MLVRGRLIFQKGLFAKEEVVTCKMCLLMEVTSFGASMAKMANVGRESVLNN